MELRKLYQAEPFDYSCRAENSVVSITCLWYLDSDQGSEGLLSPMCSKVICPRAANCNSLSSDRCPLTRGYGDELNSVSVRVLQNHPSYEVADASGRVIPCGQVRPDGYCIWFGQTTVIPPQPRNWRDGA
jgi:hypothetical protein